MADSISGGKVELLSPGNSVDGISFYLQWFAEAWVHNGGKMLKPKFQLPHILRVLLGRYLSWLNFSRRKSLIVLSSGRIESAACPYLFAYEIIPVLWDVWPANLPPLISFIRRHKVKTLFCTSSQTVEKLRRVFPKLVVVWVPEGIKIEAYPNGDKLINRPVDILSYGRQMEGLMSELLEISKQKSMNVLFRKGREHLFSTPDELTKGLRSSKLTICYPQSMTHPRRAAGLETLTQRYWEAMLSGTLPIGHAPRELITVCGYNPVVELGANPCGRIEKILGNIADYQNLVDKNRKVAEDIAGWDKRMPAIMEELG